MIGVEVHPLDFFTFTAAILILLFEEKEEEQDKHVAFTWVMWQIISPTHSIFNSSVSIEGMNTQKLNFLSIIEPKT